MQDDNFDPLGRLNRDDLLAGWTAREAGLARSDNPIIAPDAWSLSVDELNAKRLRRRSWDVGWLACDRDCLEREDVQLQLSPRIQRAEGDAPTCSVTFADSVTVHVPASLGDVERSDLDLVHEALRVLPPVAIADAVRREFCRVVIQDGDTTRRWRGQFDLMPYGKEGA